MANFFRDDREVTLANGQAVANAKVYYLTNQPFATPATVDLTQLQPVYSDTTGAIQVANPVTTNNYGYASTGYPDIAPYLSGALYTVAVVNPLGVIISVFPDQNLNVFASTGPTGPTGNTGATGPAGPQGTPGVLTVTNDVNVTGSVAAGNLTLGWTGVLSAARGGTGTATPGSISGQNITISGTYPNEIVSFSGILPIANGGNGTATPGIVQGSGIIITGTWPFQTVTSGASGTPGSLTAVQNLDVSTFAGADLGAKINTAQASAPAAGCVLDLRNFASPQTLSTAVNITGPHRILATGLVVNQSATITLTGNNSGVIGTLGRDFVLTKSANLANQIIVTGNDCVVDNVTLNGGIGSGYTGNGIQLTLNAARPVISNCTIAGQFSDAIHDLASIDLQLNFCDITGYGVNGYNQATSFPTLARIVGTTFVDVAATTGSAVNMYGGQAALDDCRIATVSVHAPAINGGGHGATINITNCKVSNTGNQSAYTHTGCTATILSSNFYGGGTITTLSPPSVVSSPVVYASGTTEFIFVGNTVYGPGVSDTLTVNTPGAASFVSDNTFTQQFTSTGFANIHVTGEILGIVIENNLCLMQASAAYNYGIWAQYTGTDHFSGVHIIGNTINGSEGVVGGIYIDNHGGSANAIGNLISGNFGIDLNNGFFFQIYDASGFFKGMLQDNESYGGTFNILGNPLGLVWNQREDNFVFASVPIVGPGSIMNLLNALPTNPVRVSANSGCVAVKNGSGFTSLSSPQWGITQLTGQTGFLSAEAFGALPAGTYILNWNAYLTTAGGASSTLGTFGCSWTTPDGVAKSISNAPAIIAAGTFAASSTANTTGTHLTGVPIYMDVMGGTNVDWTFNCSSSPASSAVYSVNATIEVR
jgi:hypothetical protein